MHDAGLLIAVHGAQLGPAQRQVAVGALLVLVDHQVKRTVHRLEEVVHVIDGQRSIHVLLVEPEVARGLPQPGLADMRRVEKLIAVLQVLRAPEVLDCQPDPGTLWMPVDETRPGFLVDGVQVELLSEPPVVPLLDLLQLLQVALEIRLGSPRRAVDPLEHLVLLIPTPVCPCDGGKLEGLGGQLARAGHVRAAAEISEGILRVGGDLFALGKLVDELQLVGLVLEQLARVGAADRLLG